MKELRLYILPLLLVLTAAGLLFKSVSVRKEIEQIKAQAICRQNEQKDLKPKDNKLTQLELITAKQIVESLTKQHDLIISTVLSADSLILKSEAKQKNDLLKNYAGVLSFLSSLNNLPYSMDYRFFCLGNDCSSGFDVTLGIGRRT